MDPLTALSLAGTIVQFVDFASQIVRVTVSGRALPVHEELETRTIALRDFAAKLRRPRDSEDGSTSIASPPETPDKTLQDLCDGCAHVADELLARLDRLKVEGKHQMWKSFQNAIKLAWSQKELDSLSRRLSGFRKSLDTHVLSNLNDTTNAIALQQSKRFDEIDRKTQNILEALLESKHARSEDVYDQNLAAAQLLSRTELVVTDQDDKTRTLIVNIMQVLSQAKEEHISSVEKDKAEKIRNDEEELQALAEENILDNMSFETMADREEAIAEAHQNTFILE